MKPKYANNDPNIISTGGIGIRSAFATKGLPHMSRESVSIRDILECITRCGDLVALRL